MRDILLLPGLRSRLWSPIRSNVCVKRVHPHQVVENVHAQP
jgi:hypothetical protein